MHQTKNPTHGYGLSEVLRRGAPLEVAAEQWPKHFKDGPVGDFLRSYNNWLNTFTDHPAIATAYGKLFVKSESVFLDPDLVGEIGKMSGPNIMAGMISGDTELGLMELVKSWESPKPERYMLHSSAEVRFKREGRRIGKINRDLLEATEKQFLEAASATRRTIGSYDSSVTSEGVRLAMQFAAHDTLGELLAHKTEAPKRGIKNIGAKVARLATDSCLASWHLQDSNDPSVRSDISGSLLEAESLIILWVAAQQGMLKWAWPIAASQRLDYAYFKNSNDSPKADLLCMFPSRNLAIPIQIHSRDEPVLGEAISTVVIHKKDLYSPSLGPGYKIGAIALGVLGEEGGASEEYIFRRAQFVASKVNQLCKIITE